MKSKKSHLMVLVLSAIFIFFNTGCNKFTEIPGPINKVESSLVYKDDASANSAVLGIYSSLNSGSLLTGNLSAYAGLSADELNRYNPTDAYTQLMNNNIATDNTYTQSIWNSAYSVVAAANACIDGLSASTSLTPSSKNQFLGESKFLRAYAYFYLTNLFGEVPMLTVNNWQQYATIGRTAQAAVYQQIIQDLTDAQSLLPPSYSSGNKRANKWAASALMARVNLYQQNWTDAETKATLVISNSQLYNKPLETLNSVFLINSKESIWQIEPVSYYKNPQELILIYSFGQLYYFVSDQLFSAFENSDLRKTTWLSQTVIGGKTYYYPFKYQSNSYTQTTPMEYHTPLRLAEQYLIRAEARAHQNNIDGAVSDLNVVRIRAGLSGLISAGMNMNQCLAAVEKERRVELFGEWGHRWLDLKRTLSLTSSDKTRADDILGSLKGSNWQSNDQLYPIPAADIKLNTNLGQNLGYQ
ncbi:RagB/SusD family nutrient uptake outer membrane protein [Pedobacter sp. MC2016-24]|uniref:RagB/SusD family nutrient uptake outer membrane protein n=1 Tax=Pedobacter sp. MC2016-24 TaxID=2780090 RepID=UPI0018805264|nr:RagB/SusD family nutrient uptake outer membrane protein [Pedobacter sp. MC2016-24]MBE9601534.1 RagB/SusD family nutrient uptake outer membrane protein [Pedobacter sp. MC2016-24]